MYEHYLRRFCKWIVPEKNLASFVRCFVNETSIVSWSELWHYHKTVVRYFVNRAPSVRRKKPIVDLILVRQETVRFGDVQWGLKCAVKSTDKYLSNSDQYISRSFSRHDSHSNPRMRLKKLLEIARVLLLPAGWPSWCQANCRHILCQQTGPIHGAIRQLEWNWSSPVFKNDTKLQQPMLQRADVTAFMLS